MLAGLATRWDVAPSKNVAVTVRWRTDRGYLHATLGAYRREEPMRSKAIRRTDYLIDSYQVSFESGAGWFCVCAEFTAANDCRHTREAQGRHAAQVLISNRLLSAIDGAGYRL